MLKIIMFIFLLLSIINIILILMDMKKDIKFMKERGVFNGKNSNK